MKSNDSNFSVTQIPLKVKKVKKVKNNKKTKIEMPLLKEDKLSFHVLSTVKCFTVIVLLIITGILIYSISKELDNNKESEVIPSNEISTIKNNTIIGNWYTENNSLFIFDDNNIFYWYDDDTELDNNYYSGTYTYKIGKDAINEMGYTEEEVKVTFGENIDINDIYSIVIQPNKYIKAHKDMSSELKTRETWWFLLIKKSNKEALGYNKTLDIRYKLNIKED